MTVRPPASLIPAAFPLGQVPRGLLAVRSQTMAALRKNRTATRGGPLRDA